MKSLKKTLVLLVVLSMILSAVSPVFAFNDVIDEDYAEQANKMAAFGVFTGDANGNFNAEENITRAEMAVVIGRLMGLTTNEANANQYYATNFSDVAAGEWYTGWVNLVAGRGIISGFPDGTFRPNEKVTQAQAVTMIVKALGWGVVVDQTGTWPANYITKASELRLFKNAVETNSELVTRGNVAIYCYNALTAKTWDVTESTDGSLTSSSKGETILVKYFSDFVNDANQMKLVEDATVVLSGANTTAIGANQIKIKAPGIASFIDAKDEPRRGKEDVTYNPEEAETIGTGTDAVTYYDNYVVACVAENVGDLSTLAGKTVDVIFGKDNEVVYVKVTNDAIDRTYVTAWKYTAATSNTEAIGEIELNGEEYEVLDDAKIYVLGYEVNYGTWTAYDVINDVMSTNNFAIANPKKAIERNILVDVILTPKDEIESINFIGSVTTENYPIITTSGSLRVYEDIVKKVSSTGKITTFNTTLSGKLEDLDEDKVTVIKNGEVIKAEEIEAGNVLTVLKVDGTTKKIYVSDTTVTGTLEKVKNEIVTIDGETYNTVNSVFGNTDGDFDEIEAGANLVEDYLDEEVEVYLNFMGEIAAVVSETEAVPSTIGIITKVDDEAKEDEDKDDLEYLEVKILSAETGKATKYYIYNEDGETDFNPTAATTAGLTVGKAVWFTADSNNVIEYSATATESDIRVVTVGQKYEVDGKELTAAAIASDATANEEKMQIGSYIFDDGITTYYNNHVHTVACVCPADCSAHAADAHLKCDAEIEVIAGWSSLVVENTPSTGTTNNATLTNAIVLHEDDEVIFFVASVAEYATTTDEYAIVESIEIKKVDGKTKTFVTLVDGDEYEVKTSLASNIDEGDFVTYKLSDDKITVTEVLDAWDLANADADETLTTATLGVHTDAKKGQFEVDEVDGRRVRFVKYDDETSAIQALYLVKDTVTVFDLDNETVTKVAIEDLAEEIVGRYATGYASETNGNIDIIVLF